MRYTIALTDEEIVVRAVLQDPREIDELIEVLLAWRRKQTEETKNE